MGVTKIRGNQQIKDGTLDRAKLQSDFLEGSDLNLTNGANDATITGLAAGVNPNDAVNKSQLDAISGAITGGLSLRDDLGAPADLTGTATGNAYIDANNGYLKGDYFIVTTAGLLTTSDGTVPVEIGDTVIVKNDVASNAAVTNADIFVVDNSQASDVLTEGDVVDSLASTSAIAPLSANQGNVLDGRITTLENRGIPVWSEAPAVTNGVATVTLANAALAGTERVYLNGLRQCEGVGNDYTISGTTITFDAALQSGDVVVVDYNR